MARVLVIRAGAIGDFVLTLPLFEAVGLADSGAEVEILGYPRIAELAVGRRHASSARAVDGAEWAPLFARSGELGTDEREVLAGFDRVYCVWPDAEGVIRENLERFGAREVVGLDPLPVEGKGVHAVDFMARQCERAGLAVKHREPHLYPSVRDRWWVERYMRVTGAGQRPLLGLHPGSGSRKKNWPSDGFRKLAQQWIATREGNVLVLSGPADEEAAPEVVRGLDEERVFVMRNELLPRVAAAIERCEAFVGNDSGISHIAAAVRTPAVVIFGPTDARLWQPRAPRVEVVTPPEGEGLSGVKAADVLAALTEVLRGRL